MSKEEILENEMGAYLQLREQDLPDRIYSVMDIYAQQESDKKAIEFKNWCDEYISTFISSDELEPKLKKTTEQLLEIFNNSTK